MNPSSMLSWIGIRPRIFGGFALVLSFLVVLAGFAMVQVEHIGGTVNELVTSSAGDAGMSQVRAALLASNAAAEKFIRTWNVGDKDAATKAIEKVGKLAGDVQGQYGRLQIVADGIGPVLRELEVYRSAFAAEAEAVDRLRAATIKADNHGAVAGLTMGGIQVALANRTGSEPLYHPMRLAGVVDAVRFAMMRFDSTLASGDADDARVTFKYAQAAIADAEIAGTDEARLKSLVTSLKATITADMAALEDVVKLASNL